MKILCFFSLLMVALLSQAQIVLNEIQAANNSTLTDNAGDYEDWIELYNPNDFSVEIGGLVLKDNVDSWAIPTGDPSTLLPAKGYFLLWADDEEGEGPFHTNFKLSASNGEFVGLFQPDGTTLIDSITFPPLDDDVSFGRCGSGWVLMQVPTPREANSCNGTLISGSQTGPELNVFQDSGGEFIISLPESHNEPARIAILAMDGKIMADINTSDRRFNLDPGYLKAGVYFILARTGDKTTGSKIVVTR
ncbi:MAG: lamin tail domain-containing protein [Bacteroidota bacterium]